MNVINVKERVVEVPNHRLEIIENVECMDCLLNQQFKDHLKEELTRLLVNTSPLKLAQIVAQLVVNSVDRNENDDIERIEGIIHTKNVINALVFAKHIHNDKWLMGIWCNGQHFGLLPKIRVRFLLCPPFIVNDQP